MGGWSAKDADENQWIQIDIGNPGEITKVSTQGEAGESTHHVTSYLLSFSSDGENFQVYQEAGQDKVFKCDYITLDDIPRLINNHAIGN